MAHSDPTPNDPRPNFLVIVADDLGFSDCSCYGSEIQTPNIDNLAQDGLRFTEFHVAAACSPTRSMLMTGTDHHIAGLGQLQEFTRLSPAHQGQPGHEGYLNSSVVALPELLRNGGYQTFMSGEWHLGLKPEHHPVRRGFDKSFALLPGCANHYDWEPTYKDPANEPIPFFEVSSRAIHVEDNQYIKQLPRPWYSSDGYTDKMLEYLKARMDQDRERPFFAYLPYSAPHWPLQAPETSCVKYRGMYSDGPDALRGRRLAKLQSLGLVSQHVQPYPKDPDLWDTIDQDTRDKSAKAMEVYAGMVDRMDWNIGRVIDHLKETGEYDNTLILFMSDNGAEEEYYDNSLDNIGRRNSFVWYGAHWAQAATAPSRLFKMFSTEGGCRVPLIVKPPASLISSQDQTPSVYSSLISDAFCTVMDIVPTFLDLAGLEHPGPEYNGRPIAALRGRSWKKFLQALAADSSPQKGSGEVNAVRRQIHGCDYVAGFEIAGSGALRRGDYKITFVPAPRGPQKWELFNVRQDPGETRDLGADLPDLFAELLALWEEYRRDVGVVGLGGEFKRAKPGDPPVIDEFNDPYGWIKYIGKPERIPAKLKDVVPEMFN
ncbi:hypothetical protein BHE90_011147 [Fusarium euwallaceae]|uniref:Sulfatase N-terminal domain-containing protein n=1 Tax=Fusarium euwallaceae TaxID=1147111 RepID=A0A430LFC7_9HYPO|nr:hypothetical protein BHE90_011147 [Fusarium euwallaceae]